ncbi:hypothetical protein GGH13_000662 [Coemansia sp. S155-1]|nr:hypothetical protein GGH13_000662 [Coemansia sp. S155-1]
MYSRTITDPQYKSTPVCNLRAYEFHERQVPLDDRRELLASTLGGLGTSLPFPELLGELGLESAFKVYESATGAVFNTTSDLVSAILAQAHVIRKNPGGKSGEKPGEKSYVKRLMAVVQLMHCRIPKIDALPKHYAQTSYRILDSLDPFMDGEPFPQPDVAFDFNGQGESFNDVYIALKAEECVNEPDAHCQHIGQLADYALALWKRNPISRPVRITGRCTYLFNAEYCGKKAVLKLTWTRTDRLPEGAVYRVLEAHGVSNIPKIYKSGVIIKDFDGYRFEVLVMEHCGTPVAAQIKNATKDYWPVSQIDKLVKDSISNVLETLTEALAANILHRDISPGNIAIKDETAYVIDWSCAKILHPPADLDLRAEVAKHWSFDWDEVLATENGKDSSTGTPFYMSTRLLLKAWTRSIFDDLESLLYVILDGLSDRPHTGKPDVQPLGFRFYDGPSMAMTRIACTQSCVLFCHYFGVNLCRESTLGGVLDAMRRFLFFDNGEHLGARILEKRDFPRNFDDSAARVFMSDTTAHELMRLVGEKEEQSPPPPLLVSSAEQDALGDDDDVGGGSITARTSNSDAKRSPINTQCAELCPKIGVLVFYAFRSNGYLQKYSTRSPFEDSVLSYIISRWRDFGQQH